MLLGESDEEVTRALLSAGIRRRLWGFPRASKRNLDVRRRWLFLSRRADDRRLPPPRFECLAKFVWLRSWTKAFGLPRGSSRHLNVAAAHGPGKFVELFFQVKNLFLQIYYVPRSDIWLCDSRFSPLELTLETIPLQASP